MNTALANPRNYEVGRRGLKIRFIIIHSIVGSAQSAIAHFQNPTSEVSAHYVIGMDGIVTQTVLDKDTAYHAGQFNVNLESLGIEHDDKGQPNIIRPDELYEASAQLVAQKCKEYGIPCNRSYIKKHSEIKATTCPAGLDIDRIIKRANEILNGVTTPTTLPLPIATVISEKGINIRKTPSRELPSVGSALVGEKLPIQAAVNGENIDGVDKWYQLADGRGFIFSATVSVNVPNSPTPTAPPVLPTSMPSSIPNLPTAITIDPDVIRAGTVVKQALPELVAKSGEKFGNAEGAAREMVFEWNGLITGRKEAASLLEKLQRLIGF